MQHASHRLVNVYLISTVLPAEQAHIVFPSRIAFGFGAAQTALTVTPLSNAHCERRYKQLNEHMKEQMTA